MRYNVRMNSNLFFFTGEETYLLQQKVNSWKQAFLEKHGELNLGFIDGEKASASQIIMEIETVPFLGEKRLIFIENLPAAPKAAAKEDDEKDDEAEEDDLQTKKFVQAIENLPETSVVVFIQPHPDKRKNLYKALIRLAKVEEFEPLDEQALNKWVCKETSRIGGTIDPAVADYFISMVNQNCWRLAQEIQKLACFKPDQSISQTDIDHVVTPTPEANIFHFTDALATRDHRKAIRQLHKTMAAGDNLRQLFYMIVRQFRLLLKVKSYKMQYPICTPASVSGSLGLHPFVARNVLSQISHFKMNELKQIYAHLLEIDTDLKSSQIRITSDDQDELALAIEQFILRFCR